MQRYEYDTTSHWKYPDELDHYFRERVSNGWRLVTVLKVDKETYVSYWEKPC